MKLSRIILIILFIIYALFIYMDLFTNIPTEYISIIKYIGIILCFILALIKTSKVNRKDSRILQIGLFFTIFADLALVILEDYVIGVIIFTIIQLIYIFRYTGNSFKKVAKNLLVIFVIMFSSYFIISKLILDTISILIPIGLFYAICLITSVTKGINISKDDNYLNPNKHIIGLAMVLFLLCDVNIAIAYVLRSENLLNSSYIFSNLIWVFYFPSQILLSLSGYDMIK